MCHAASLTWSGTMHLTSRACGRRVLTLAYLERHVACASACRTRCHLRRNARPSAVKVRRVALLDCRTDSVREADVGPIPGATISRDCAISRVRLRRRVAALDKPGELPCPQW